MAETPKATTTEKAETPKATKAKNSDVVRVKCDFNNYGLGIKKGGVYELPSEDAETYIKMWVAEETDEDLGDPVEWEDKWPMQSRKAR